MTEEDVPLHRDANSIAKSRGCSDKFANIACFTCLNNWHTSWQKRKCTLENGTTKSKIITEETQRGNYGLASQVNIVETVEEAPYMERDTQTEVRMLEDHPLKFSTPSITMRTKEQKKPTFW